MSLRYLWNKLENMNSLEQEAYIKNIFEQFDIKPIYPIEDNFIDTPGKESKSKNPLGYLVMHLQVTQLEKLVPKYYRDLLTDYLIFDDDWEILNIIDDAVRIISFPREATFCESIPAKVSDMLEVFEFGVVKYSPWSFLKLNPYKLVPALFRHLYKHKYQNPIDNESGLPHLAHAACNLQMIKLILERREDE